MEQLSKPIRLETDLGTDTEITRGMATNNREALFQKDVKEKHWRRWRGNFRRCGGAVMAMRVAGILI